MGTFTLVITASTNSYKPTIAIIETDGTGSPIASGGGMGRCLEGPFAAIAAPFNGETKLTIYDIFGNTLSLSDSEMDPVKQLEIGGVNVPMLTTYTIWKEMKSYLPTAL